MRYALCLSLIVAVFVSAIAAVVARHQSRKLFVELQALESQRDVMNEEWGRLQLEQATWGTYARVENLARSKLGMTVPPTNAVILVMP